MVRPVRQPRTRRPQVSAELSRPQNTAVARPVSLGPTIAPRTGFQELASALQDFAPTVGAFTAEAQARQAEADFATGKQARALLGDLPLNEEIRARLNGTQSAEYQIGFMRMHGQLQGHHASRKLASAYEAWADKDTGDINQFIMDFRQQNFADLDDEDFLAGFMPVMEKSIEALRVGHLKDHLTRLDEENHTSAFNLLLEDIQSSLDDQESLDQFFADISDRYESFDELFGLEKRDTDALVFEAVRLKAEENLDMSLFEFFDMKRPDGTPGLSSNPKWAEKIALAKEQTQRQIDAAESGIEKQVILDLMREGQALAEKGRLTKADENSLLERGLSVSQVLQLRSANASYATTISDAQKHIFWEEGKELAAAGSYTEERALEDIRRGLPVGQARSLRIASMEAAADVSERALIEVAIQNNNFEPFKPSKVQQVFDDMIMRGAQQFGAKDDVSNQQVLDFVISQGAERGLHFSPYKRLMDNATVSLQAAPQKFNDAFELYSRLQQVHPQYAASYVDEDTALAFDVYSRMLETGDTPANALENLALAIEGLPEAKTAFTGSALHKFNDAMHEALVEQGWFSGSARGDVPLLARTFVRDLAIGYAAMGHITTREATSAAVTRFLDTHTELSDGVWVKSTLVPPDWDADAMDWVLTKWLPNELEERGEPLADGYWLAQSHRTNRDGTLAIYEEGTNVIVGHVDLRELHATFLEEPMFCNSQSTDEKPMDYARADELRKQYRHDSMELWRITQWDKVTSGKLGITNQTPLSQEEREYFAQPDPPDDFLPLDNPETVDHFNTWWNENQEVTVFKP